MYNTEFFNINDYEDWFFGADIYFDNFIGGDKLRWIVFYRKGFYLNISILIDSLLENKESNIFDLSMNKLNEYKGELLFDSIDDVPYYLVIEIIKALEVFNERMRLG